MTTETMNVIQDGKALTAWPLRGFSLGDFASVGDCMLKLDSGSSEFGLLYKFEGLILYMAQFPKDDKPVYFHAAWALAVCYRPKCRKVCIQFPDYQVDLEFENPGDLQPFLLALKTHATKALMLYEVPMNVAYMRKDFSILKYPERFACYPIAGNTAQSTMDSFASTMWKTGAHSDFIVKAGGQSFNVHKAIICTQSKFFENVCKPDFLEGKRGYIELTEDAPTVSVLLAELYGVGDMVTGSIFTKFSLETNLYKEKTAALLLKAFVAADKYNLDQVKSRLATSFIDRLSFIFEAVVLVDMANFIYNDCPEQDCGLRLTIMRYIQVRLPLILCNDTAKENLAQDYLVVTAVLGGFASMMKTGKFTIDAILNAASDQPQDPSIDGPASEKTELHSGSTEMSDTYI